MLHHGAAAAHDGICVRTSASADTGLPRMASSEHEIRTRVSAAPVRCGACEVEGLLRILGEETEELLESRKVVIGRSVIGAS